MDTRSACLLALGLTLLPGMATAQTPDGIEKAQSFATAAEDLDKDGDYDGAIRFFQKAYDLVHEPVLLYNIARMHDKKGDLARAREFYERYLKEENDPVGNARGTAKLNAVLDRIPGRLVVETEPAGAAVEVDDKPVGKSAVAGVELKRGPHEVRARAEGYAPATDKVEVKAGEEARLFLTLKPALVTLTIACDCKGSKVELDGYPVGEGPLEKGMAVMPGQHTVAVVPEAGEGVTRTVAVAIGKPARLDVRLRPEEALRRAAETLARDNDLDGAIRMYRKALDLNPEPGLLLAIGQVYERRGDLANARDSYERFLAVAKEPGEVARGRASLEAVLERTPGKVGIVTEPTGAAVEIDGKPAGTSPIDGVELRRGPHEVKLSARGFEPATLTVVVKPGETVRLSERLKPAGQPPVPRPPAETAGPSRAPASMVVASVVAQVHRAVAPQPAPVPRDTVVGKAPSRFPWQWVAIGTGAAMIATGGVLTALAHQDRAKVTDAGKFSDGTLKIARSEALSLQSSADRKAWASVAMYGVGGAAVVTGVVLWLTSGRGQAATPGTVLSATPAPGGVVVGATGRF